MADIIIASYFTSNGSPASDLSPIIRIWEIGNETQSLVVSNNNVMDEVIDGDQSDGFYRYIFTDAVGYDPLKSYTFRVDGGEALTPNERYQVGELNTASNASAIVDLIYDEPSADHISTGTFGEMINQIAATGNTALMRIGDVSALLELSIKYSTNRTKIDHEQMQMIIFDTDCVTPLRTFQLLDKDGNPSITDMCERVPIADGTTDGLSTCM